MGRTGRGPTMFMSPLMTFKSCGISSSLYLRRNRPMGVKSGSSGVTRRAPMRLSASASRVRNL